jgi:hypothetical protein
MKMTASWVLRCVVALKFTDVPEVRTASIITLTMEAVRTSEISVNLYTTTQRKIPKGCHLHVLGKFLVPEQKFMVSHQ